MTAEEAWSATEPAETAETTGQETAGVGAGSGPNGSGAGVDGSNGANAKGAASNGADSNGGDRGASGALVSPEPETPGDATGITEPGQLTEAQLEALLFVAERPLSRREIAGLAGVDRATVDARLGDLEMTLAGRGIRLVVDGDRVELATAAEAGALIARYVGADAVRLSPAAIETLSIVAYRQPVTKAQVERIRGVDSDYTIRSLLHRRLVVELGRSEAPGRPFLYGTGFEFLERFGLTSLEELPVPDPEVAARLAEAASDSDAGPEADGRR